MQSVAFIKAWRERARALQKQAPAPALFPDDETLKESLQEGESLIQLVQPEVPPVMYAEVLAELTGLLHQHQTDFAAEARLVRTYLQEASFPDKAELATAALDGSGEAAGLFAQRIGVSGELFYTLTAFALQPFFARFASVLAAKAPLYMWRNTYCPICGSLPDVARIDPDNMRHLHCPQCDTQWVHHRLTCAVCDTDDVKKVQLLTASGLEPWRVECCDECGGYVKTLDQRHAGLGALGNADLFVEDARTVQLDVLAQERGYRRGGRVQ